MRKKDNCKVMILKNIQLLVNKDRKSYPPNNSVHLCGSCTSMGYQCVCVLLLMSVYSYVPLMLVS